MEKELIAIGYRLLGERIEFNCNKYSSSIWCNNEVLVSLEIPEVVLGVSCWNNYLTDLNIPDSVEWLDCRYNYLTDLNIPDSVEWLDCRNNNISELVIGEKSMLKELWCDKHVKGLDTLIGNENLILRLF